MPTPAGFADLFLIAVLARTSRASRAPRATQFRQRILSPVPHLTRLGYMKDTLRLAPLII